MYRILFFIFIIGFTNCTEKPLDDILPFEGQKLVLEGFITATKPIAISVFKTLPPTGDFFAENNGVTTATVYLFEDDILVETLQHDGDGLYISPNDFRPKLGKSYHIEVTAADFPKAVSKPEMLPDSVPVFTWDFTDSLFIDNNTIEGRLAFDFQDIINEENFYNIIIEGVYDDNRENVAFWGDVFSVENPDCELFGVGYFKDKCFENDLFSHNFITNCRRYGTTFNDNLRFNQLRLTLRIVPKSYYDYEHFLSISLDNEDNPFAEPTEVYTNINGGYGVFTTYLERVVIINL